MVPLRATTIRYIPLPPRTIQSISAGRRCSICQTLVIGTSVSYPSNGKPPADDPTRTFSSHLLLIMMRPARSKHGLDRKYKPWRKGKSSAKKIKGHDDDDDDDKRHRPSSIGGSSSSHSNASLKNMLRSQKRLLEKLQREREKGGETDQTNHINKKEAIDATQQRIHQLEQNIRAHEAKEREKKNAVK